MLFRWFRWFADLFSSGWRLINCLVWFVSYLAFVCVFVFELGGCLVCCFLLVYRLLLILVTIDLLRLLALLVKFALRVYCVGVCD